MKLEQAQIQEYLKTSLEAANSAGQVLKKYWGQLSSIKEKGQPDNLVTEADVGAEKEIIAILQAHYPEHAILGEESGFLRSVGKEPFLWVIDPLDGTTNYAHQFPFAAVSIALLYQNDPIVGVVYNPMMGELFYASRGAGAYFNQQQIKVSQITKISDSLLATGFAYQRREKKDNNYKEFCHLTNLSQGVRRAGAASLDLAYVAAGRFDGYWENDVQPWDVAAGVILVEEAGGKVSAYDQSPLEIMKPKILASNGKIHEALSRELLAT